MPARRLLLAVCALALTACTPLIDDPSSPSTAPAASETSGNESTTADAQAPTFELGEFDPEGDFELFDPCTEIPAEVLTEAGLGEEIGETTYDRNLSAMCTFDLSEEVHLPGLISLTGDRNSREKIDERGFMVSSETKSAVPGVYLHVLQEESSDHCSAAVHTTRGRFAVMYDETMTQKTRDELCQVALAHLEEIQEHLGETNGTVHRP